MENKTQVVTVLDFIKGYVMSEMLKKELTSMHMSPASFRKKVQKVHKDVNLLSEKKLLMHPLDNWHQRFDHYFNSTWELKKINLSDCGHWPKMGGLPEEYMYGDVSDTTKIVSSVLKNKKLSLENARVLYTERLMKYAEILNEFMPLVLVEGGLIRQMKLIDEKEKVKYKKCKYDIEDGNHRALALALLGRKEVFAFVGKRTTKNIFLYN